MSAAAPTHDPQADTTEQPGWLVLTEIDPKDVDAVRAAMRLKIEDAIQKRDVEELEVGDKMVSRRSGTVREIIEKTGPANFLCLTTKTYQWSSATNYCFRKTPEPDAANMRSVDLLQMNPGETVYGPNGEKMTIKKIIRSGDKPDGTPYGIEVVFEEKFDFNLDTFGKWLHQIIKKDATVIGE